MSQPACRTGIGRYAYRGRHRKPSTSNTAARSAALSAGVVAAVMVGSAAPASASPSSNDPWYQLRMCESGGNYQINTGNGYYGAYQFNVGTWRAYGGAGYPHQASPAEQDYRAKLLYRARGWSPWPACSARLGLRNDPAYGRTGPAPERTAAVVAARTTARVPGTFFIGRPLLVRGTATPGSVVDVFAVQYGQRAFRHAVRTRANADGAWSARLRVQRDTALYAVAAGKRSTTLRSKARWLTTLSSPSLTVVNAPFRIGGQTRPNATVLVLSKPFHSRQWTGARKVRANGKGQWSLRWRASTDWRFQAYGDTRTGVAASKVATTVNRPVRKGARSAALSGSARPASRVTVYTMRYGSRNWVALTQVAASAGGQWSAPFTPTSRMAYYARSSSGVSSPVGRIA